jgi:hypothetical protein
MQVTEWAQEGFLGNLNDVADAGGWNDVVPAAIQQFGTYDGEWVAAPVNVHRPNWLWMNREVFESNNLDVPTTWDEFNAVAEQLQALDIIPLAHGGQPWQDATIFDDVVLGIGGPDFYQGMDIIPLAHGGQPWQDATVFDDVVLGIGGPEFYRSAITSLMKTRCHRHHGRRVRPDAHHPRLCG